LPWRQGLDFANGFNRVTGTLLILLGRTTHGAEGDISRDEQAGDQQRPRPM